MDFLDLIIILCALLIGLLGYHRGISWVGLALIGLCIGITVGALLAVLIAPIFPYSIRPVVATSVFLIMALLVETGGTTLGFHARIVTLKSKFARLDSVSGACLAAIGLLGVSWYISITFANSPWVPLDTQIKNSFIERTLDKIAPRPPGFFAVLGGILQSAAFPNPFDTIAPQSLSSVSLPASINTSGIKQDAALTEKVYSYGCGGIYAGTAWPIRTHYLITNAHVVAGSYRVDIITPDNKTITVTVVYYDPNVDVAVLYAPNMTLTPLPLSANVPTRGTQGANIGYPNGGNEIINPSAIQGTESAQGYNIYNTGLVTRNIALLSATIIPGDSGGPLVELNGTVMGIVFATSTTNPNQGYALTIPEILPAINAATSLKNPVSTQQCVP